MIVWLNGMVQLYGRCMVGSKTRESVGVWLNVWYYGWMCGCMVESVVVWLNIWWYGMVVCVFISLGV